MKSLDLIGRGVRGDFAGESKIVIRLCSLNFLLSIIGYPLVMSLLSPFALGVGVGENVFFTYPYRFFQALIVFLAFLSVRNRPFPRISWKIGLLGLFWLGYLSRSFWDLVVSPPYNSSFAWNFSPGREFYFISYVLLDSIPLLVVLKGWDCIDFQKVIKWLLVLGGVGLLFSLKSMQVQVADSWTGELGRVAASRMLHTQALGNFGCCVAIAAFWMFFNTRQWFWKALAASVGVLALYMMLKAGSRGPVFGFAVVVCTWFSVRNKNFILAILAGVFAVGVVLLFQESFLSLIKEISPVMETRMRMTLEGGDTSGRDVLWAEYWAECLKNPILGFQLERLGYPHNMFLDGLMMFGMIGGWIIALLIGLACVSVMKMLRDRMQNSWWSLFLLAQLVQSFTQSGFSALAIQAPLLLLFIFDEQDRRPYLPLGSEPLFVKR